MSWRDKPTEDCEMCQVLYRDDGAPLGCVLRLLWRQLDLRLHDNGRAAAPGACPTDDEARRAVGTEEGALW
jgi:hypothetical protein